MTRSPFTDSYLDTLRACSDPVADAVITDFVQVQGITDPQYVVQQLIQHQRTLPPAEQIPSVRAYFDTPIPLPPWADVAVLRQGQEVFRVFGVHIASALFCASLPMSYAAVDGSRVLARTAELVSNTRRRLAHTGEMLLDVMGFNDDRAALPFAPETHAYGAPHGVRLFHAAVRHMLRNDDEYDVTQRGEPINQEDLLGTLTVFTVVVVEALERFGVKLDASQRDAYLRVWLTAGFLLGIEPTALLSRRERGDVALGWEELVDLRDAIAGRHVGPSPSGQLLMSALLEEESEPLPFPLRGLPRACTRTLIGPEYSEYLAIPPPGWTRFLLQPLPLVNRLLFNRRYYDLSGWLFARVTRSLYGNWISVASADPGGGHPQRYRPVWRAWNLEPAAERAQRVVSHPLRVSKRRRTLGTAFAAR
jgi:hypothetical protein